MITKSQDGTAIGFRTEGTGAQGVVLVHGWSCTGSMWGDVLSHLPHDGRTFVIPDLRGHGSSSADDIESSVRRYAEDVLAAADAAGLSRFIVVGHSMGAKYGQYVRVLAPERVVGYVGVAPTPSALVEEGSTEEGVEHMAGAASSAEAFAGLLNSIAKGPLSDEVLGPLVSDAGATPKAVLAQSMRTFSREDYTTELQNVPSVPVLIIGGDADPIYPADVVNERAAIENPHAKVTFLDGGHLLPQECPRELAALLDEFFTANNA
ncbi:alpha/beta fold hydrolase [Nocardia sp. NPDC050408]|uniref:alpha/beta fold hydrolase n=1 Tax=Nocardia sp. NPDC050408 TaxID=3364319 RepID=UPI0037AE19DA